jgi:hypothetical protein
MLIRPRSGRSRLVRHTKIVFQFGSAGCLKLNTWHPWGLTPDITCLMAPSFPAASIARKISRIAWRLDAQ